LQKTKGAQIILYLCLSNENMEIMLEHETLFGTVSRTLRDDYKKSIELTLYLLNIFQAYSNFTQFHEFLITNQIGDTTIKIIDHEIKRYVVRVKEFKEKSEHLKSGMTAESYEVAVEELRKDEKKLANIIKKQEKVLFVAFHLLLNLAEDLQIERKIKNRQVIYLLISMLERNNPDLLFIVLNFIKKLSIFGENKNEMKD
jgi:NTP pyrophosphatase (non-canonical NTP hydrolase)